MGAIVTEPENIMRVGNTTPPQAMAQSIFKSIFSDQQMPVVRAVGAGAVCQACKGIAIARSLVAQRGRDLATTIGFDTIKGDQGTDITAQTFHLFLR